MAVWERVGVQSWWAWEAYRPEVRAGSRCVPCQPHIIRPASGHARAAVLF